MSLFEELERRSGLPSRKVGSATLRNFAEAVSICLSELQLIGTVFTGFGSREKWLPSGAMDTPSANHLVLGGLAAAFRFHHFPFELRIHGHSYWILSLISPDFCFLVLARSHDNTDNFEAIWTHNHKSVLATLKDISKALSPEHPEASDLLEEALSEYRRLGSVPEIADRFYAEALRFNTGLWNRLKGSETRLLRFAELSPDLIYRVELVPAFRYLYVSPIIESWMGVTRKELYDDPTITFQHIHSDDFGKVVGVGKYIKAGQGSTVVRFVTTEGKATWVEHRWFVDQTLDDDSVVIDGMARDITPDIRQQQAIQKALKEAEETARAKSMFLANMSHEIRTPLNAIIGQVELLLGGNLNAEQREMLDSVQSSGKVLLGQLSAVLDFSKLDAERVQLESKPVYLEEIANTVLDMLRGSAKRKGLALELIIEPGVSPVVLSDKDRLTQILVNLTSNAVKFTNSGSVVLRISRENQGFIFKVMDTGRGFPQEDADKLLEPFTQADLSSTKAHEGTGLGLAITKRLVSLMNGQLDIRSQIDVGSTFTVTLPLLETLDERPKMDQAVDNDWSQVRVLIAEDNQINRKVILRQLKKLGLPDPVFAHDGLEAVELYRPDAYDLVLMDIQMPNLDGVAALIRLTEKYPDKLCPMVAVTANALPGDARRYTEAGFDDYLSKPVRLADLERILQYTKEFPE